MHAIAITIAIAIAILHIIRPENGCLIKGNKGRFWTQRN